MKVTVRRKLAMLATTMLVVCASLVATAPSASAATGTISGSVQCIYGNNAEVGVWVDTNNGTDGYATLTPNGNGGVNYSYTLSGTDWYRLYVGCSGTPSSWGSSIKTVAVYGNYYDWVCSYQTNPGFYCAMS